MENNLNEIIKESQHMAKVSDRILDLANQLLELTGKTPEEVLGTPFPEETTDFAKEEFEQMTQLPVRHE